jgi:iron(III) transport system ATP-binding protein
MAILALDHISKKYSSSSKYAVEDISFSMEKGEIMALVGESGSGKTTLLRLIAGLEHPDQGTLSLNGEIIVKNSRSLPANKRNVGMVFQDYALFPHMTIEQNIAYGLHTLKSKEKKDRIQETLALVDLNEDPSKYPHQLSGGQQQRVALARAIAPRPSILLLDEPFSNLDSILRDQVREEVKRIIKQLGMTAILVTHDTKDALSTADRITVMNNGRMLQNACPENLYENPATPYVAQLFGKYSTLKAQLTEEGCQIAFGNLCDSELNTLKVASPSVHLFFRPEHTLIVDLKYAQLKGIIESISYMGDQKLLSVRPMEASQERALILSPTHFHWKIGDTVGFALIRHKANLFNQAAL